MASHRCLAQINSRQFDAVAGIERADIPGTEFNESLLLMSVAVLKYDSLQSAFHEAFRNDLEGVIHSLPLSKVRNVIDSPCGSGFYSEILARTIPAAAQFTAFDANAASLERTRKVVDDPAASIIEGDAYAMLYPAGTFDFAWCAESLISLDPARTLRELHRILTPDGVAVILEVDAFHHMMLPWPAALEVALPKAIHSASLKRYDNGVKLAPALTLRKSIREAGYESIRRKTHSFVRVAPFDPATRSFLNMHIAELRDFAVPFLAPPLQQLFKESIDGDRPDSLFRQPDAEVTYLLSLYFARPRRKIAIGKRADGSVPAG